MCKWLKQNHIFWWQVDCEAWLSKGDPKLVICKEAKERQPDLLVLGSRGLGTLQRYICHSFHDPRNLSSSISEWHRMSPVYYNCEVGCFSDSRSFTF
jgi:hypothetical protein